MKNPPVRRVFHLSFRVYKPNSVSSPGKPGFDDSHLSGMVVAGHL